MDYESLSAWVWSEELYIYHVLRNNKGDKI
jgi:hypothetical protein